MADPALGIQSVLVAKLKADAGVSAIVGTRVYDRIEATATYPFVGVGDDQVLVTEHDDVCFDGSETFLTVQAFSRAVGYPQVKQLAAAIRAALKDWRPTIAGSTWDAIFFEECRYLRDDGLTSRAILTFRAVTHTT